MQPLALDGTTEVLGRVVRHGVLGDGPDVVLCHGTPWPSWLWGDVAHDLARDHRVHLDRPEVLAQHLRPWLEARRA